MRIEPVAWVALVTKAGASVAPGELGLKLPALLVHNRALTSTVGMNRMKLFETARTVVRHFEADDLDGIARITGDPEGSRYVGDGQPLLRSEAARWIEISQNNYRTQGYGASAIIASASGAFIGIGGLVRPSLPLGDAEIIYYFDKPYWGQGYAKEVVPALLDYGFRVHHLGRVIATIHPDNTPSKRVAEFAGMRFSHVDPPHFEGDTPAHVYVIDNPYTPRP